MNKKKDLDISACLQLAYRNGYFFLRVFTMVITMDNVARVRCLTAVILSSCSAT